MAGIYIHIPFCKQRCTYCDFYTQVAPHMIPNLVEALIKELQLHSKFLKNDTIETIYFGGGTPSLLTKNQFEGIFDAIYSFYKVSSNSEITFEANPDDLTDDFFESIQTLAFNRISIGIQAFDDEKLKSLNRRHSAKQAIESVKTAQKFGFKNISIDLIYGLPNQSIENCLEQLSIAFTLDVQHISIYGLTYETGTRLFKQKERGEVIVVSDDVMIAMYELLLKEMNNNDFKAYEISNFSKPGFQSKHNSSYWNLHPYLGIGPSAHSFNGLERSWNIASTKKYIDAINSNTQFSENEILTTNDLYNDYIMIRLRTSIGIDKSFIINNFGDDYFSHFMTQAKKYISSEKLIQTESSVFLSIEGIHISNLIISDLMIV